jgi:hypothetical protein
MAKKKTAWVPMHERPVADGIGFNPGSDDGTHIVVVERPLNGMHFVGPFTSADAAHRWVAKEGLNEMCDFYGGVSEIQDIRFHVRFVHVLRKEVV